MQMQMHFAKMGSRTLRCHLIGRPHKFKHFSLFPRQRIYLFSPLAVRTLRMRNNSFRHSFEIANNIYSGGSTV